MNILSQLDDYLTIQHHTDTWSDFAYEQATTYLDELNDDEWSQLHKMWANRPTHWQVQLADALSSCEEIRSVALIATMLQSDDLDVLGAVLDSLEGRDDVYKPDQTAVARLEALFDDFAGTEYEDTIQTLLDRA